jgi:hypothetical protein
VRGKEKRPDDAGRFWIYAWRHFSEALQTFNRATGKFVALLNVKLERFSH